MTAVALDRTLDRALDRAVDRLFTVPGPYRSEDLGRGEASQLLGCDDDTLSRLVHLGLPATGEAGQERFDSRDVFNLGLYGGISGGVAEQMFRLALRWMRGSTESLAGARTSEVSVTVACDHPGGCGADPRSTLVRPEPERYGGTLLEFGADPAATLSSSGRTVAANAPSVWFSATVHTRGEVVAVHADGARDAMRRFLDAGLRWIRMPEALGSDVNLMLDRGIASCASASLWVAQMCREAGVPATTRSGWVAGMELNHAWVEIDDSDGRTKVLDPVFALFAQMVPDANPVFRDPTMAVRSSRLIPTGLGAGESPAGHRCGGQDLAVRPAVTTRSRPSL